MTQAFDAEAAASDRRHDHQVVLVLGGGNALGAYHAGVYETLAEAGIEPDWVVGASIGAIVGAIIAGNRREDRIAKLRRFWRPADRASMPMPWDMLPETWRRTGAALETVMFGQRGLFGPLDPLSIWGQHRTHAGSNALYDTHKMRAGLAEFIHFDLLNSGPMRFTATAIDVNTGDDVCLDTRDQVIGVDHIRASAALLSTFPAVEVEGRLLGDGGLSMNLPLDPVLGSHPRKPVLCFASDLLPLRSGPPRTLGEVIGRTQDLIFAAQSRRTIMHWQGLLGAGTTPSSAPIKLVKVAYSEQNREVAGKAMDFSPRTVRERWDHGRRDAERALLACRADSAALCKQAGLTIIEN